MTARSVRPSRLVSGSARASRRARRGSQAIEVGLLLPVLVTVLAGVVDLASYLVAADGVVSSVAEGARAGAASDEDEGPTDVADQITRLAWANTGLPGVLTVTATVTGESPDQWLVVEGSVPTMSWFGFIDGIPHQVSYRSTVRLVHQRD